MDSAVGQAVWGDVVVRGQWGLYGARWGRPRPGALRGWCAPTFGEVELDEVHIVCPTEVVEELNGGRVLRYVLACVA